MFSIWIELLLLYRNVDGKYPPGKCFVVLANTSVQGMLCHSYMSRTNITKMYLCAKPVNGPTDTKYPGKKCIILSSVGN